MRMMPLAVMAASLLSLPTLVSAQERILTIYGKDKCPSNTICVTAPEGDRYRIPKELRPSSTSPQNESWASRSQASLSVGSSSPTACTSAVAGNGTGCWAEAMRRARAERKQNSKSGQTDNGGLRKVILGGGEDE